MTKDDIHNLTCLDNDCERVSCVYRRESISRIAMLKNRIYGLEEALNALLDNQVVAGHQAAIRDEDIRRGRKDSFKFALARLTPAERGERR